MYNIKTGRILKPVRTIYGYYQIGIRQAGKLKVYRLHRQIAKAFVENTLNKPHVNHKDGDKQNNAASNLEWVTPKENSEHSVRTGLHPTAASLPHGKLTPEVTSTARDRILAGELIQDVCKSLGVAKVSLYRAFSKLYGKQPLTIKEARKRGGDHSAHHQTLG